MSMLNLDTLLDSSMAEVAEAANYVTPENGIYVLKVVDTSLEIKKSKDTTKEDYAQMKHVYEIVEVVEQEGMPIAPGSLFNDQWMYAEKGLEFFKTRTLDIAEANGEPRESLTDLKLGELLQGVKDMTFKCVIQKVARGGVGNEGKYNVRINNICKVD